MMEKIDQSLLPTVSIVISYLIFLLSPEEEQIEALPKHEVNSLWL